MTYEEFQDWKRDPRTQEIFGLIGSRVNQIAQHLAENAGITPANDRFMVGQIAMARDLLAIEFEKGDETDDSSSGTPSID